MKTSVLAAIVVAVVAVGAIGAFVVISQQNNDNGSETTYTVTWENWDGTVLVTKKDVKSGTQVTYTGETPTRATAEGYKYTFSGWSPSDTTITKDTKFTAQFTSVAVYTVTWQNWDGTVLETDTEVESGTVPTYDGDTPEREGYYFKGWTPEVAKITGDTTYTAEYSSVAYTVTWINYDGTVLETDEYVAEGATPSYDGETPVRARTEHEIYYFAGWNPTIGPVVADTTYIALFNYKSVVTVTWMNGDEVLGVDTEVVSGTAPVYDGETPTKDSTETAVYTFSGWDPAITSTEFPNFLN